MFINEKIKKSQMNLKQAAMINAASKYSTVIINLLITSVLARILTPEDYGIVAVTAVFTTFFSIIADMGLGAAVIQNKELTEDDINSIFSFTVRQGTILMLCFAVFSVLMSLFYNNSAYISVGLILAVSLFFSTVNMIPNALLMKNKEFINVGIRTIVMTVAGGIIAIIFAFIGFGYYALVLQSLISGIGVFVWNYLSTKPRFVLHYKKESLMKIRRFSSFQFAFNIINYFARNSDNLLISKFMGESALGFYDKAYKLMLYPINYLTNVITPVMHPILSDYQNDKNIIYEKYVKVIKLLSLIGLFITPFCFISSNEIILIVFGKQWSQAVPCFRYMTLAIWSQLLLSSTGSVFQSAGRTDLLFKTGCVTSALTVIFIIAGLIEGNISAVARNIAISYNIQFIFSYYMLIRRTLGCSIGMFIKELLPDIIMLILLTLFGVSLQQLIVEGNLLISILMKFFVVFIPYIIYLMISKRYKDIVSILERKKK